MADQLSTNFFAKQEEARRNSRKLVILFIAAVAAIIVVIYFALRFIWVIYLLFEGFTYNQSIMQYPTGTLYTYTLWDPLSFILIAIVVSLIIVIAGIIKTSQLRGGGGTVAEMLGGTLILSNTHEPVERQLLNVVEEMAIASGVPVPLVFVLNKENGINI